MVAGDGLLSDGTTFSLDPTVARRDSANAWTGENDFSASDRHIVRRGSGTPAAAECAAAQQVGSVYARADAGGANATLYVCANSGPGSYSWELVNPAPPQMVAGDGLLSNGTTFSVNPTVARRGSANAWTGENDFSASGRHIVPRGAGAPAAAECATAQQVGGVYARADAAGANATLYVCANSGPGAYSWELVNPAPPPPTPIVNGYLNPYAEVETVSAISTAAVATLNRVYMWQFVVRHPQTITKATARIITSAAGSLGAALYSSLNTKLAELKLSTEAGVLSGDLTTPLTLQPGVYYLAMAGNGPAQISHLTITGTLSWLILNRNGQRFGYCTEQSDFARPAGDVFPPTCTWNPLTTSVALPLFILE
jgi:hypothetical protein